MYSCRRHTGRYVHTFKTSSTLRRTFVTFDDRVGLDDVTLDDRVELDDVTVDDRVEPLMTSQMTTA